MTTTAHGPRIVLDHCCGVATPADTLPSEGQREWCDCRESAAPNASEDCMLAETPGGRIDSTRTPPIETARNGAGRQSWGRCVGTCDWNLLMNMRRPQVL